VQATEIVTWRFAESADILKRMKSTGSQRERREVIYRGRVQGVGFRYSTQAIAARFEVAGFVMNLPDGRVQLVAEGTPRELEAFLDEIGRTMGRHIENSTTNSGLATGGFDGFEIRRY